MNEAIYLHLIAQGGVLFHYAKEWVLANQAGKHYDLKKALPMIVLSSMATFFAVLFREEIKPIFDITKPLGAFVAGYAGNSFLFSVLNTKKPKNLEEPKPVE